MITPVSLEIAKLLKEKGFDRKCTSFYDLTSNNQINDTSLGNYNLTKQSISIPTIAEVVMWLYEKYGIWIEVQCPDMPTELWSFNIHRFQKYGGYGDGGDFNSPTEAYQAAIEYTLNNLIP